MQRKSPSAVGLTGSFLLLFTTAFGVEAAASSCVTIDSPLDRLACYDKESGRTPSIETITSQISRWSTTHEKSKMTDQDGLFLSVESKSAIHCRFGNDATITLMIRCMEGTTSIYIATQCHLASSDYNDYGHVRYRIDTNPAGLAKMNESTDHRALGLWSGSRAIPFIKQMLGGKELIAQFTPYGESPVSAEFPIAGIDDAIKPLREACKW